MFSEMKTSLLECSLFSLICLHDVTAAASNNEISLVESLTENNNSNCYTLQMKGGSLTYCNITSTWKPSVRKSHALAAGFMIGFVTMVFIIFGFKKAGVAFRGMCCTCQHNAGCFTLFNFVAAAVLRIIWKLFDVGIDTMTYYRLGSGSLIDNIIYRNPHVVNSLLAFTCVGVIATLICFRLIYLKADDIKENGDVEAVKLLMILIAFLLEDSIQMFLEYYWIQKYVTINIPVYLVIKDVVIAFIAFHSLLCSVWVLKSESSTRMDRVFFTFGVVISLVEFLRVGAVIKQYRNGVFNRDCLKVRNGKLWQTPFDSGCMRSIDYWILVLTFLPFLSVPFLVVAFRGDIVSISRRVKIKFTSQQSIVDAGNVRS